MSTHKDRKKHLKAAKIWAFCLIAHTGDDLSEDEVQYEIRKAARSWALQHLRRLGVSNYLSISSEEDAIRFVRHPD